MNKQSTITFLFIIILALIPVNFWFPFATFDNPVSVLRSLGQVAALVGTVLFCINFILATRWRFLENLFFGLNRVYIIHHLVGAVGFVLLLIHPTLIISSYLLVSLEAAFNLIVPSIENAAVLFGSLALLITSILLVLTLFIRPEYDRWKKTHQWLGLGLLFATLHGFKIGSTLDSSLPLRIYIYGFFILAISAFVYRFIYKLRTDNKFRYIVEEVIPKPGTTVLKLKPEGKKMSYKPGQFAFIQLDHLGIARQSHPFSMTSAPSEERLSFGIKSLGEFTETIRLTEKGTKVLVEGSYGRFSYVYHSNPRQVWIGGGIGITPFVSMLKSLPADSKHSIVLFYCGRDREEAVFADEIAGIEAIKPQVKYVLWLSKEKGRISVDDIIREAPDFKDRDILLCCPPSMLTGIRSELVKSGYPISLIHTEEFEMA